MDERKPPVPPNELNLQPASGRISAVVDLAPADLTKPCRNEPPTGPSVAVYCGSEEEVSLAFLIALRAMGVPLDELPSEPPKPPVARAEP